MTTVEASKYVVDDAEVGITNSDYLIAVLDAIGSKPAKCFIYDDVKECEDIDLIAYFIILYDDTLEEDLVVSIADNITFKDFLYIVIDLVEKQYQKDEYCTKYETNIEKLALEMYLLATRFNYQRLNKPLFKELCSVNYNTFHNTIYDLIAKHSPEGDMELVEALRNAEQQNKVKEKTFGDFFAYVHRTMNQHWCPSNNIRGYRNAVLNGHRLFLKEIIMPLAFGINIGVIDFQTIDDVIRKYM